MQVHELMTANPEACLATESCARAIAIMRRRNCGFVPIVDDQLHRNVIGVVTDRDIALHLGSIDSMAMDVLVEECMSTPVKSVGPSVELEAAVALMEREAIHRLVVVSEGRLVGVLSLKDIAMAAHRRWNHSEASVTEHQVAEIVEAIAAAH